MNKQSHVLFYMQLLAPSEDNRYYTILFLSDNHAEIIKTSNYIENKSVIVTLEDLKVICDLINLNSKANMYIDFFAEIVPDSPVHHYLIERGVL